MHRSRLAGFIVDCETADLEAAADFWSKALGLPARRPQSEEEQNYVYLQTPPGDLHIEVQKVAHPSRVHLDIEADDLEAEARRLERLGARRVGAVRSWIVMEAPTGQRFCVVRPTRAGFEESANQWQD